MNRDDAVKALDAALTKMQEGGRFTPEDVDDLERCARDVLDLLKAQEPCMDAVSREAVLDLAQTYGPTTYDMPYGSGDMIILPEDVKTLPSVHPIPLARVMTLEEALGGDECWVEYPNGGRGYADCYLSCSGNAADIYRTMQHDFNVSLKEYGRTWRCWTFRPTDAQREAVKWDE